MCQITNIEDFPNVFLFCATNCPGDLDTAILRRFHKRLYVPLPNEMERLKFFQHYTKGQTHFETNVNWEWDFLLKKTHGYSYSDLSDIIQTALNMPITELQDTKIWKITDDGFYEPVQSEQDFYRVVCSEINDLPSNTVRARKANISDLMYATGSVKATVSESEINKYCNFINL